MLVDLLHGPHDSHATHGAFQAELRAGRKGRGMISPPAGADLFGLLLLEDVSRPPGRAALGEVEALARVITSEAASHTLAEKTAIAWAVRNAARKRHTSIAQMVCKGGACGPCCKGRPFSSARAGSARDRELAQKILSLPQSEDPTGGATAILEPALADKLVGTPRGREIGQKRTSAEIHARWTRGGMRLLRTVGRWELWG
jgi:hypothetical protein